MTVKELAAMLESARHAYITAPAAGRNVRIERERLFNLMFSHADEIIKELGKAADMAEEIDALDRALKQSDDELRKLKAARGKKKAEAE